MMDGMAGLRGEGRGSWRAGSQGGFEGKGVVFRRRSSRRRKNLKRVRGLGSPGLVRITAVPETAIRGMNLVEMVHYSGIGTVFRVQVRQIMKPGRRGQPDQQGSGQDCLPSQAHRTPIRRCYRFRQVIFSAPQREPERPIRKKEAPDRAVAYLRPAINSACSFLMVACSFVKRACSACMPACSFIMRA